MGNIANRVLLADYLGGQASGAVMGRNYIKNPSGLFNVNNISVANSATVARNTGTPLTRIADIEVTLPNNTNGYAEWAANLTDLSIGGQNCEVRFDYIASSIGSQVFAQALDTGTVVAQQQLSAASSPRQFSMNVPCNGTGATTTVRITNATGNSGTSNIKVANMSYGKASNVGTVAQASLYGTVTTVGTTDCRWTVTSNQSFSNYAADTDCNTAVATGNASAPSTKIPGITFQTLPPGQYLIKAVGYFYNTSLARECSFRFSDGTNHSSPATLYTGSGTGSDGNLEGVITYNTAQNNVTIQVQGTGATGSQTCDIINLSSSMGFQIQVYRFPSASEQAVRPDVLPASWSGYHGNNCSWSRTSTAYGDPGADAVCTFIEINNRNFGTVTSYLSGSDKLPGIVFTPARAGRYLVMVDFQAAASNAIATASYRMETSDGVLISEGSHVQSASSGSFETKYSLKGIADAASTSPLTIRIQCKATAGNCQYVPAGANGTIFWTVIALDQSFPAPLLVGSVTSNSSGLERVERVMVSEDPAACSASPCTITNQTGSWVSSVTRSGTGTYTVNIAAGIFSTRPSCFVTGQVGGAARTCNNNGANTTTTVPIACFSNSGANIDMAFQVLCMGPKG